jgi:hypothetical protein
MMFNIDDFAKVSKCAGPQRPIKDLQRIPGGIAAFVRYRQSSANFRGAYKSSWTPGERKAPGIIGSGALGVGVNAIA